MGPLAFTWDASQQILTGVNKSSRGSGFWKFQLKGNAMHGTLTIDNKTLSAASTCKKSNCPYRIIRYF